MMEALEIWTRPLAEALLNGLWQGLLLATLTWLFLKANRRATAAGRYAVWYITLAVTLALPIVHLLKVSPELAPPPMVPRVAPMVMPDTPDTSSVAVTGPAKTTASMLSPIEIHTSPATTLLVLVWLAGAAILCVRLALAYRSLGLLKRSSRAASIEHAAWWRRWLLATPSVRTPTLRISSRIRLPLTAGLTDPAILFPEPLLPRLTEAEAHAVWLHELGHVRRLDDWTKLGQRIAEALLLFNPAVHYIGRRLELEREIACDDWAVGQTGSAKSYAACLAKLAEYGCANPVSSLAPAMAADRKQIFRRVNMIIEKNKKRKDNESRASGILAAAAILAVTALLAFSDPVLVLAQEPEPPAPPPVEAAPAPPPAPALPAAAPAKQVAPVPPAPPTSPAPQPRDLAAVAPPALPAPAARPLPSPAPSPAARPALPQAPPPPPPPPPTKLNLRLDPETRAQMRAIQDEIRERHEEIRKLSHQIQSEMHESIRPQMEQIRKLSHQINTEFNTSIRPLASQMGELHRDLAKERMSDAPNRQAILELEKKLQTLQTETLRDAEDRIKEFEQQIEKFELDIRPKEESMRKLENEMRKVEEQIEMKARQLEELELQHRDTSSSKPI